MSRAKKQPNTIELHYRLCPHCYRATPASLREVYCPNDGSKLLTACPNCGVSIASPYSHFCVQCGLSFKDVPKSLSSLSIKMPENLTEN